MNFLLEEAEAALAAQNEQARKNALEGAFVFSKSPQGHDFWAGYVYLDSSAWKPLREALEAMIAAYKEEHGLS